MLSDGPPRHKKTKGAFWLGGIGNGMVVYKHKINLKVRDEIFKIEAAFSKERFFDINIIGRKDVFNKMNITFARDKEIVIEVI